MNASLRWLFVLVAGFGWTWGSLYQRRQFLQGGVPPGEFVVNFGVFAAISTALAAVLLALLFREMRRTSHLPVPQPRLLTTLIFWLALAGTAVYDVPQSIGSRNFQWDELLNHLCGVAGWVGVYGVALAMRLPEVAGARLGKR